MAVYHNGIFTPKNPSKNIGKPVCIFRSAWEHALMTVLDNHPNVLQWASESIEIPYRNPLTGKHTIYIPDFLVIYVDKNGKKHGEILEVKPQKETSIQHAKSTRDRAVVAINMAKWQAAVKFASSRGLTFRVLTEYDLFGQSGKTAIKRRRK